MSITSGPINEGEQAAEKFTDHAIDRAEKDAPVTLAATVRAVLDALAEYEFVLGLRKRQ
jgi:hypothetical protein